MGDTHTKESLDRAKETLRRYFDDPRYLDARDARNAAARATKAETKRIKSIVWANTMADHVDGRYVDYPTWSKRYDQSLVPAQRERANDKVKARHRTSEAKERRRIRERVRKNR
jgi:hypothetical protein